MRMETGRCEWCNVLYETEIVVCEDGKICELCSEYYGYGDVQWQAIRVADSIEELISKD